MQVKLESTTDPKEAVEAAIGLKKEVESKEAKAEQTSAPVEETDETAEASDATETEESSEEKSADEADENSETESKPKKKNGFKKRIDKLSKQKAEAERQADYWRNEALKTKPNQEVKVAEKELVSAGKPKADDFESHDAYIEALTDWKTEQKFAAREAKQKESEVKTHAEKQREHLATKIQEFKKGHEDFDEVLDDVSEVPMSMTVQEVILESDNGPELMYALAKNKDEYKRICALTPIAAARELGKLEARLSSSEQIEIKKTSAPKPITPVGKKAAPSTKSPDEMNYQEYKKWREAQARR